MPADPTLKATRCNAQSDLGCVADFVELQGDGLKRLHMLLEMGEREMDAVFVVINSAKRLAILTGLALTVLAFAVPDSLADSFQSALTSPKKGRELSERLCSNCHVVSDRTTNPITVGIPSFIAIANDPRNTPELIAGSIIIPHPPMPSIELERAEIRDIVAYIQTLKTN